MKTPRNAGLPSPDPEYDDHHHRLRHDRHTYFTRSKPGRALMRNMPKWDRNHRFQTGNGDMGISG